LAAPLLGVNPQPASGLGGGLFLLSLCLSVAVGLALEFLSGALMIRYEQNIYAFRSMREALRLAFSGAVIPLALLPWGLGRVFDWLPFASMASAPLRIYTGTGKPLGLLALQGAWVVILWPVALG